MEKEVVVSKMDDHQVVFKGFRYNNLGHAFSLKSHLGGYDMLE
jgi:hypothetical protein